MGNRAVITTAPYSDDNVGIYVHWNGGRASVEGFLKAAKELDYRSPGFDRSYALAGLAGLIWSYLGTDGLSVGIDLCKNLDTEGDNGVYLIDGDWEIVGRRNWEADWDEEVNQTKTDAIAKCILAKAKAAKDAQIEEPQV